MTSQLTSKPTCQPTCQPTRRPAITREGDARRLRLNGLSVELLPSRAYEARYALSAPEIGFAFERQTGRHAFDSDKAAPFTAEAHTLSATPAGCEVYSMSEDGGEYLRIASVGGSLGPVDRRIAHDGAAGVDPRQVAAARRLRRLLLAAATPVDPLAAEHAVDALTQPFNPTAPGAAGWMTRRRRRVIEEMVEEALSAPLTVAALADRLGLSAGFFSRAFKASFGVTPWDYVLERRLAHARSAILAGADDLSAVACDAGFASHAHMSAAFTAKLGVAPSALRPGRRP